MPQTLTELPMMGPFTISENGVGRTPTIADDGLADYSAATFVDLDRYLAPPNTFLSAIRGHLAPAPELITRPGAVVYARFQADGPLHDIVLQVQGKGDSSRLDPSKPVLESSLGTLYPMDGWGMTLVNDAFNGYNVLMDVVVPSSSGHDVVRISEAWIVVAFPTYDAPPCRLLGRGDGLGVGAGRNYPPPKSQQRSSRGVGYY